MKSFLELDKVRYFYFSLFKCIDRSLRCTDYNAFVCLNMDSALSMHLYFQKKCPLFYNYCLKRYKSLLAKRKRLKLRILSMRKNYGNNLFFLTLTFRDDVLNSTSFSTRRKYITRYLKSCISYVGNVDYGSLHNREHYHFIVANIFDFSIFPYGFFNFEKISFSSVDALKNYVLKLENHFFKKTCGSLVYSRNFS